MLVDTPSKSEVTIIIDVSHMAYRAYYANQDLKTTTGLFSGHVYGTARMLLTLFQEFDKDLCAIYCYDGKGAKAARQKDVPEYKANRKPLPVNPIGDVKQELLPFFPGLHVEKEEREGDDAIAWVAKQAAVTKEVVVYSGDKDLWGLLGHKNINVYSPTKARMVTMDDVMEEFHVSAAHKIYLAKSLFGDSSDNIKGVERLIKKQVEPVLEKCSTPEEFYAALETKPASMTDKMYGKAIEVKDRVIGNYKVLVPRDSGFSKEDIRHVLKTPGNRDSILSVLEKYECKSLFEEVKALFR